MEYQKLTKVSKNSQQNNSETITNDNDKEIPKERYISPKKDRKLLIILVLIFNSIIMEYQKKKKFVREYTNSTNQILDKILG